MTIRAWVIIAVTFEQIDNAPYAEARADGDNEYLQRVNCGCEKCHSNFCRQNRGLVCTARLTAISASPFQKMIDRAGCASGLRAGGGANMDLHGVYLRNKKPPPE